ncbi:hypothetical protein ERC79_19285 [Rhodococcus sp. ABRD24]|uniref:hypothetical protein n=1 Tax=Rhodococcus sp. ABRD24 TaxID=2507582 RepID=UPI001039C0FD|nr:hypothetical protein [Rhodococcus sp. ABRD24]QBJ97844.1 hypothetical protein ERC79_19285 [Rhodococcus sp. ABRD24]
MGFAGTKYVLLSLFLAGLVGAGIGLSELHVHVTVAALIVAAVSGLLLLRIRAESHGRIEPRGRIAG